MLIRQSIYICSRYTDYQPDTTKGCSTMYRVAMHEAGHVFGLYDRLDPSPVDYSVMWMLKDSLCTLTRHDIFAIEAIYESEYYTNRYVNQ